MVRFSVTVVQWRNRLLEQDLFYVSIPESDLWDASEAEYDSWSWRQLPTGMDVMKCIHNLSQGTSTTRDSKATSSHDGVHDEVDALTLTDDSECMFAENSIGIKHDADSKSWPLRGASKEDNHDNVIHESDTDYKSQINRQGDGNGNCLDGGESNLASRYTMIANEISKDGTSPAEASEKLLSPMLYEGTCENETKYPKGGGYHSNACSSEAPHPSKDSGSYLDSSYSISDFGNLPMTSTPKPIRDLRNTSTESNLVEKPEVKDAVSSDSTMSLPSLMLDEGDEICSLTISDAKENIDSYQVLQFIISEIYGDSYMKSLIGITLHGLTGICFAKADDTVSSEVKIAGVSQVTSYVALLLQSRILLLLFCYCSLKPDLFFTVK